MNIRKEKHPNLPSDGDDESNSRQPKGQKRERDDLTVNYAGGKKPRYDKSGYDRNRYNNFNDKDKKCVICNMNNHSTSECRNLTTAQNAFTQAKNRYRSEQSQSNQQANFGNQQKPILSGNNPLNQALANQLSTQRSNRRIILNEWLNEPDNRDNSSVNVKNIEYKNHNTILQAYTDDILHDHHVIHDSGANCGIFKNINILNDIRISNETATINGIGGNLTTNVIGTFHNKHDVYYHPDAVANILSQSAEKDNGATITYDNDIDEYLLFCTSTLRNGLQYGIPV